MARIAPFQRRGVGLKAPAPHRWLEAARYFKGIAASPAGVEREPNGNPHTSRSTLCLFSPILGAAPPRRNSRR